MPVKQWDLQGYPQDKNLSSGKCELYIYGARCFLRGGSIVDGATSILEVTGGTLVNVVF